MCMARLQRAAASLHAAHVLPRQSSRPSATPATARASETSTSAPSARRSMPLPSLDLTSMPKRAASLQLAAASTDRRRHPHRRAKRHRPRRPTNTPAAHAASGLPSSAAAATPRRATRRRHRPSSSSGRARVGAARLAASRRSPSSAHRSVLRCRLRRALRRRRSISRHSISRHSISRRRPGSHRASVRPDTPRRLGSSSHHHRASALLRRTGIGRLGTRCARHRLMKSSKPPLAVSRLAIRATCRSAPITSAPPTLAALTTHSTSATTTRASPLAASAAPTTCKPIDGSRARPRPRRWATEATGRRTTWRPWARATGATVTRCSRREAWSTRRATRGGPRCCGWGCHVKTGSVTGCCEACSAVRSCVGSIRVALGCRAAWHEKQPKRRSAGLTWFSRGS